MKKTIFFNFIFLMFNIVVISIILGCTPPPPSDWEIFQQELKNKYENNKENTASHFKDTTGNFSNIVWFRDSIGVHKLNLIDEVDTLIFLSQNGLPYSQADFKLSPLKSKVAFVVLNGNQKGLILLDLQTNISTEILRIPDTNFITFEWSQDGMNIGIGYRTEIYLEKNKNIGGDLLIYSVKDEVLRSIGCNVSRIFKSWLPNGLIAVEGYNDIYIVDTIDCKTINIIRNLEDKSYVRFSPDGLKVLYFKKVPVYYPKKGRKIKVNELFIADASGQNEQIIFDYTRKPRKAKWSPDSRWIACETTTPKWSNVHQVMIYNCMEDSLFSIVHTDSEGQIDTENPHWSADGSKLVYDISASFYGDHVNIFKNSVGILNFSDNSIFKWSNKTLRDGVYMLSDYKLKKVSDYEMNGEVWGVTMMWLGNEYIFTAQMDSNRIYDLKGRLVFSFPESKRPFAISRSIKK